MATSPSVILMKSNDRVMIALFPSENLRQAQHIFDKETRSMAALVGENISNINSFIDILASYSTK